MGSDPEFSKNLIANEIGPSNRSYDSSILMFSGVLGATAHFTAGSNNFWFKAALVSITLSLISIITNKALLVQAYNTTLRQLKEGRKTESEPIGGRAGTIATGAHWASLAFAILGWTLLALSMVLASTPDQL